MGWAQLPLCRGAPDARKRFRFEDVARDETDRDILLLKDAKAGAVHRVIDPRLSEDQIVAVQAEVFRVLGWE